jgi:Raf kinase inhibitor-like YbhB/YbcL family protein
MHSQLVDSDYKLLLISSKAFEKNYIPKKYSGDGENVSPPLSIDQIPLNTRSLVVIMEDVGPKNSKPIVHWLAWNLPVTPQLEEDYYLGQQGLNDFGTIGYEGPCVLTRKHDYTFKVYALDELLDLNESKTKAEIEAAMQEHILAYGELTCKYSRPSY